MNLNDFLGMFEKKKDQIEPIIAEYINNEKNDPQINAQQVTKLLVAFQMKQTYLLDFFNKLKFYFLNGRENTRQRASELVFQLFSKYQGLILTSEEVESLFAFFLSKLSDFATVKDSYNTICQILYKLIKDKKGLQAELEKQVPKIDFQKWKSSLVSQLISQMSDPKLCASSYNQEVRQAIYSTLIFLQDNFLSECVLIGSQLIQVVIDHTEDEKDPRCILLSFKLIRKVLENFSKEQLEPFVEDIFNNLECYFPIDFQQDDQLNKKHQIQSTDLAYALETCLIHKTLRKRTLSMLHEKISSSFLEAKIASLKAYQAMLKDCQPKNLTKQERKQILDNILENAKDIEEKELSDEVVQTIYQYMLFLIKSAKMKEIIEVSCYEDLKKIVKHSFSLLEDSLLHPNAILCEMILSTLVPVSESVEIVITNAVAKYFNSKFSSLDSSAASKQIELVLIVLLAAEKKIKASFSPSRQFLIDKIREKNMKTILIGEILNGTDEQNKIFSIAVLSKLAQHGGTPSEIEIEFMGSCEDIGISEMDIENYSSTVKKCLVEYCFLVEQRLSSLNQNNESYTVLLQARLLGLLGQENMIDHVSSGFGSMILCNNIGWKKFVEFIVANVNNLSVRKSVEVLVNKVLTLDKIEVNYYFLDSILCQKEKVVIEDKSLLKQIKKILARSVHGSHLKSECCKNHHQVSSGCLDQCSENGCSIEENSEKNQEIYQRIMTSTSELAIFSKLIKALSRSVDQSDLFQQYFYYLKRLIDPNNQSLKQQLEFTQDFEVSFSLFFGNRSQDYLSPEQLTEFMSLFKQSIFTNSVASPTLTKVFCGIVKFNFYELHSFLTFIKLTRSNAEAFALLSSIVTSEIEQLSSLPQSFYSIIASPKQGNRQLKSYLNISPTYPQKLFYSLFKPFNTKLITLPKDHPLTNKCYYVLVQIMLSSPFSIVSSHKNLCLPLLIQALTFSSDSSAIESAINLLSRLINSDISIIGAKAENLLSCLLKLLDPSKLSVSCLIELIKCLGECINFETPLIKRFKLEVIDSLEQCLGHIKRPVRRHAVLAVNKWYQII